jgi:hypothetical protein
MLHDVFLDERAKDLMNEDRRNFPQGSSIFFSDDYVANRDQSEFGALSVNTRVLLQYCRKILIVLVVALPVLGCSKPSASDQEIDFQGSRRISECNFRVVFRELEPAREDLITRPTIDQASESVLDQVTHIALRTGFLSLRGTYVENQERRFATFYVNFVRRDIVRRGVPVENIRVIDPIDHELASDAGVWIRVCAPRSNAENGWRSSPANPQKRVEVQLGSVTFQVPILNFGPLVWNDEPVGRSAVRQFYLDIEDDNEILLRALNECPIQSNNPVCARVISISLHLGRPRPRHDRALAAYIEPVSTFIDPDERTIIITTRENTESQLSILTQCSASLSVESPSIFSPAQKYLCTSILDFPVQNAFVSASFTVNLATELTVVHARIRSAISSMTGIGHNP